MKIEWDSRKLPLRHERIPLPHIYLEPTGVPTYVIKKGSRVELKRRNVVLENIVVAKIMLELVKSFFGPRGFDKVVITKRGRTKHTFITSNLRTLAKNIKVVHPVGIAFLGGALSVESSVGDGSLTSIILAGKILENLEGLVKKKKHPGAIVNSILKVYRFIKNVAYEYPGLRKVEPFTAIDNILENSVIRKLPIPDPLHVKNLAIEAIRIVGLESLVEAGGRFPDEIIDVKRIEGGGIADSFVVDGLALYREVPHERMPKVVKNAKIAVVKKAELRIPNQKINRYIDYEFHWKSEGYLRDFERSKERYLLSLVNRILELGINVLVLEKGVDDFLLEYLANKKILVIWRTPPPEIKRIVKAVGAVLASNFDLLTPSDLGWAKVVEAKKINEQPWIFIRGCRNPKTIDIVLRGTSKYVMLDIEHTLMRSMRVARTLALDSRVVYGGGAFEMFIAEKLLEKSKELDPLDSYVFEAVSRAFESIPMILAESAGLDPLEALLKLRKEQHEKGNYKAGINVLERKVTENVKVLDSFQVKLSAIKTAIELSLIVLRTDKIIKIREASEAEKYYMKRQEATSPKKFKEYEKEINP